MTENGEIHGYCDVRFNVVKDAFSKNFEKGLEVGSSFAVSVNNSLVVDLWGGYMDAAQTKPWKQDTIVNVFSTTKVMTALCVHILVDRGLIDLEAPVAKYWPEFAQSGKEELPVKYLLSHSAGLPGWDEKIPTELLYDWDNAVSLLAAQKPWWKPGTKVGYHMNTFGYLLGELVSRVTGKTIGTFFREEIAVPLDIDFHIGLPEEHDPRVAEIITPDKFGTKFLYRIVKLIFRKANKVLSNQNLDDIDFNSREWRGAEIPAANGHGNARSVARTGAILACGGEIDNHRIISNSTIENAIEEQIRGFDVVGFYLPQRFALGFGLYNKMLLKGPRSFFWSGAGGSICVMDYEKKLSFGYAMNKMSLKGKDPRLKRLSKAVWEVVNSL